MNEIHCPDCGKSLGPRTPRVRAVEREYDGLRVEFESVIVLHRCEEKQ